MYGCVSNQPIVEDCLKIVDLRGKWVWSVGVVRCGD